MMVTLCRSSRPSVSARVKLPEANSPSPAAAEPALSPASSTRLSVAARLRVGPSLLPVMVMVSVALDGSPSASCMV
ncbi:hypothetical protein D3C77_497190 [compost metagenome]